MRGVLGPKCPHGTAGDRWQCPVDFGQVNRGISLKSTGTFLNLSSKVSYLRRGHLAQGHVNLTACISRKTPTLLTVIENLLFRHFDLLSVTHPHSDGSLVPNKPFFLPTEQSSSVGSRCPCLWGHLHTWRAFLPLVSLWHTLGEAAVQMDEMNTMGWLGQE